MTHLKIVNASRGPINKYEDLNRKLYKRNASIYFNKQCLKKTTNTLIRQYKSSQHLPSTQIHTAQDTRHKIIHL